MAPYCYVIETSNDDWTQFYSAHICGPFGFLETYAGRKRWYTITDKPAELEQILQVDTNVLAFYIEDECPEV